MEPRKLPVVVGVLRFGAIWTLLLSSAMAFARDPLLGDAWLGTFDSDALLGASGWLAVAAAVAIVLERTSVAGALMATVLGALPIVLAARVLVLYVPTLAAALAWLVVWMDGRNHHAQPPTLQSVSFTPHEHL